MKHLILFPTQWHIYLSLVQDSLSTWCDAVDMARLLTVSFAMTMT